MVYERYVRHGRCTPLTEGIHGNTNTTLFIFRLRQQDTPWVEAGLFCQELNRGREVGSTKKQGRDSEYRERK